MRYIKSDRGFAHILHEEYLPPHKESSLVSESSAIGDYDDAFERPGTSFLWVGDCHHLNREEVFSLVLQLQTWLLTGRLDEKDG